MQGSEQYRGRSFAGVAIDPAAPPLYESEAAYLDRLLLPGERRRLRAADFEPERVEMDVADDGDEALSDVPPVGTAH